MAASAIIDRQTFQGNAEDEQVERLLDNSKTHTSPPAASLKGTSLSQRGRHFVDDQGRVVSLRGFNVSAASKLPTSPDGLTKLDSATWFDHRNVSFVGRPFPLDEAAYHFSRIQSWGYTFIRLLVPWEALAHSGPFTIDQEYVAYVRSLLITAADVGIKVVISAHQDVWSRLCGGSGAPGWTFEAAGLDVREFMETKAAYVHNLDDDEGGSKGDPREISGPFVWPSGYQKLAAATMATLFWGGDIFAWKHRVSIDPTEAAASQDILNGHLESSSSTTPIQALLQSSYLHAYGKLADALAGIPSLLAFEVQNEPHRGFIELHSWDSWKYETDLHIGHYPSLLQALALGEGHKQMVPYYVKTWPWPTRRSHWSEVDPKGRKCWLASRDSEPAGCLWARHGAWKWNASSRRAEVLRRDYFTHDPRPRDMAPDTAGQPVEWYRDCYVPFVRRFADRMRRNHGDALQVWFEPIPNEYHPPWPPASLALAPDSDAQAREDLAAISRASTGQRYASQVDLTSSQLSRPENIVYSPHFYDLNVLFGKVFNGWFSVDVQALSRGPLLPTALFLGHGGLRRNYLGQLSNVARFARMSLGEVPVIIGEIGIPFDINGGVESDKDDKQEDSRWLLHEELLDSLANAMEGAKGGIAGWAWWNYNPDNVPGEGDYWNREDFSFVSSNVSGGSHPQRRSAARGRALGAIVRPYAVRLAGVPMTSSWDRKEGRYELQYVNWAKRPPVKGAAGQLTTMVNDSAPASENEDDATIIYVPGLQFGPDQPDVVTTDGHIRWDRERQRLLWWASDRSPGAKHSLRITVPAEHQAKRKEAMLRAARKRRGRVTRALVGLDLAGTDVLALLAVFVVIVGLIVATISFMGRVQAQQREGRSVEL
ncbi:glycoside hydrolase [Jaminaea rosea]|uniref:Glycoside hydrolase n=1 Tax=Jaminaea rosea TaxID=1569628 RepID=A0A316UWY4_9BASI|nr:glycoside hydrolase [Jaminaea rosea]PWN28423.1 glycoside hydrolase [Jaminaea rosea]